MRDWYFYQEKGKTMGPLTAEDLRARIRDGRLKLFDLIYKEGEPGWRMALEHPDLRDEFKKMGEGNTKERPWVCLHRKSETTFDFITMGPYSDAEVKEAIQSGKISYSDYIWRDDFSEWRRIGDVPEFNRRIKKEGGGPEHREEAPEDLLKNVVEMRRPSRTHDVPPVPKPSEAVTHDLTKKPGNDEPTRIVRTPLSDDAPTRIVRQPVDPDATRIVRTEPSDPEATKIVRSLQADPEATKIVRTPDQAGSDEATRIVNFDPDATRVAPGGGGPPPPPQTREHRLPPEMPGERPGAGVAAFEERDGEGPGTQTRIRRRRRRLIRISTDWAIVGSLVLLLLVVIVLVSRNMRSPGKNLPEPPPVSAIDSLEPGAGELTPPSNTEGPATLPPIGAQAPEPQPLKQLGTEEFPPPVEQPAPSPALAPVPAPPPSPKAQVSRPPTQLVLNVQGANSTQARIEVRSNGSSDHPVYVQIIGLPGQVAEGAAFYRYLKLKPTGNPKEPLDLGDVRLPQGRFILRAETGGLKRETALNLGTGETAYKQAVARARKVNAAVIWQERLQLYRIAQRLEASLLEGLQTKRLNGRGLEALNPVKKTNGSNYILFEDWWELKEITDAAKATITPALVERTKRVRERLATFTVWRK